MGFSSAILCNDHLTAGCSQVMFEMWLQAASSPTLLLMKHQFLPSILQITCLALAVTVLVKHPIKADTIKAGAGSYSLVRPADCEGLPGAIFSKSSLKGATPTNQWWSSLVWEKYSQNLFPHPLAMNCNEGGLAVAYPGSGIVGAGGHIMGGGIGKTGDFVISHSEVAEFPDTRLADYSDWFITAEFRKEDAFLSSTFGHGSPYIFNRIGGGNPILKFAHQPIVWKGKEGDSTLGVTVRGNHYGIYGPNGSSWLGIKTDTITSKSSKGYFTVALLPDAKEATLARFAEYAHHHVTGTSFSAKPVDGHLKTEYRFEVEAMDGDGTETLFALYPHQWKYSEVALTGHSYRSVRGEMKLARGDGFETSVPIQGLLPMLPAEGVADQKQLVVYLEKEAAKLEMPFADTYWDGKFLGKLATLSGVAEVAGEKKLQKRFVNEIRRRLEDWFSAAKGENAPLFYYDKSWGTLIGSKPSYGSDGQLNDHHFHYGYFIRAAAEVARLYSEWAEKWGPMVELLIRDIASTDRKDPLFPHLRCFDVYAGHSWASGHAKFGDGNNQESSSESLNAWYGLMLWGEVTGNTKLRDTGVFLYNTERTAVEEYWFDVSATNFPKDFPEVALGMVWGGKGAFSTWFSADIDCIHGINWLPFTPASIYMGRYPAYVKKNHDRIVAKREKGGDYNNGWGDLVVMFNALQDSQMAADYLEKTPDCSLEGGNTHAFMSHWIHTLNRLGGNDRSVTSSHPWVNIYQKDGEKTYAVYRFGKAPKKVTFSDGFEMMAEPGMTVKTSAK